MSDIHLLIVDKEESDRDKLKNMAASAGFTFDTAPDGIMALKLFRRHDYHLVILNMELPMLDGGNVCRQIRKVSEIPIIIVSAKSSERDRLFAFEVGADDYLCKPFSARELLARIKVFLYRSGKLSSNVPEKITFSGLFIDTISRSVYIDDNIVRLTPKEYDLLFFLTQNPNKAFSREMILNEVWGYEFTGSDRTVDTHIRTLRENLRPYGAHIETVWGFGYKFVTTCEGNKS